MRRAVAMLVEEGTEDGEEVLVADEEVDESNKDLGNWDGDDEGE